MKDMKVMKVKRVVIVVFVISLIAVLTMVLVKSFGHRHFRSDAAKWAQPSIDQTNIVTNAILGKLTGNTFLVDISEKGDHREDYKGAIHIPSSAILDKDNLKKLRAHEGNIVLVSDDPALSARIWMLLSQMGFSNLYILEDSSGNEVLKYEFQPD